MLNHQLEAFTGRRQAIALFNLLRGRDPRRPWPLLPLLTITGPGGTGKSMLLEYLRSQKCCFDGSAELPYALLDFKRPHTPRDILHILVALRNQLQGHPDGYGRNLTFPRFDLGAAIALAAPATDELPLPNPRELEHLLGESVTLFYTMGRQGNQLEGIVPYIPHLLGALRWITEIRPLNTILLRLERGPAWQWYRDSTNDLAMRSARSVRDVLLRLEILMMPDNPERAYVIEDVLCAAFIADLYDALITPERPSAWDKATNVVIFLDSFESLLEMPGNQGIRLLELLALAEQRLSSGDDALLLVVGSRRRMGGLVDAWQEPSEEEQNSPSFARRYAQRLLQDWQERLPEKKSGLRLSNLYLPIRLCDFSPRETRDYLMKLDEQGGTGVFADEGTVKTIQQVTRGHPLHLALVASAAMEAQARGGVLALREPEEEALPDGLASGHAGELTSAFFLDLFLGQLSEEEQRQLVLCAVPRVLDAAILQDLLYLSSDSEARERWERYRGFPLLCPLDGQQLIFHRAIRPLLLRRTFTSYDPESDYYRTHNRLRAHFARRANLATPLEGMNADEAQIEAAYHALALGQPQLAIALAYAAQQSQSAYWTALIEAVAQAPTGLIPRDADNRAYEAVSRAAQQHELQDSATALVLYRWMLNAARGDKQKIATIQHKLGMAYYELQGGNRPAHLQQAIFYYQAALRTFEEVGMEYNIQRAKKHLEKALDALSKLSEGQRKEREPISAAPGR
jgi:hypothetical protein